MYRHLNAILLLCLSGLALAQPPVSVFTLNNQLPQDLVPVVQPLLGDQGSVSAYGNKLIVRAPASRMGEIADLVGQLDAPPRRLFIDVRVDRQANRQEQEIALSGQAGTARTQVRIQGYQAATRAGGDIQQTVQTIEGRPALISTGRSVPVYQVQQSYAGFARRSQSVEVRYRDIDSGFLALPRLLGADRVSLEIYQQQQRPAIATNTFASQRARTVLHGRIGEWMNLGDTGNLNTRSGEGLGWSANTRSSDYRNIAVRVRLAN